MKPAVYVSLLLAAALFISPVVVFVSAAPERVAPPHSPYAPGSLVRFLHLSQEDGLSQNAGLAFLQDSRGFVWIGTQDGLNRYDGHAFTIYKNDPENPVSISHNSINALMEDRDGQIWIGTWGGGVNRFDPRTQQFTRFQHDPANPISVSDDNVTSLLQDAAGAIWVGTLGGLDRFDPQSSGFKHYRNDPNDSASLSSAAVSCRFEDSRGALWVGTGGFSVAGAGLNQLDRGTGKFTHYTPDPANDKTIAGNNISAIGEAPDGALWISMGGFGVEGAGVDRFDPQSGTFTHFKHDEAAPDSLSADNVMDLVVDAGTLWVSTYAAD
jgi:ligand-binding sensor domain-containing protein